MRDVRECAGAEDEIWEEVEGRVRASVRDNDAYDFRAEETAELRVGVEVLERYAKEGAE